MLSEHNLMLGELLLGNNLKPSSPILKGLVEKSYGGFPYTQNYIEEIQNVTSENGHSELMTDVQEGIARLIRSSLLDITNVAVPFSKAIAQVALDVKTQSGSRLGILNTLTDQLGVNWECTNHPFLSSNLYPTEINNKLLNYTNINLSEFKDVEFRVVDDEEILNFIDSRHPEIQEIVAELDYTYPSLNEYLFPTNVARLFGSDGDLIDFTRVRGPLDIVNKLTLYVLLTKMKGSENPVPWLVGGSLERYRAFVNLYWNGLHAHLVHLKVVADRYNGMKLTLVEREKVRLIVDDGMQKLSGVITVMYDDQYIDKLHSENNDPLTLIVGGLMYQKIDNLPSLLPNDLNSNPEKYIAFCHKQLSLLSQRMDSSAREIFVSHSINDILSFVNDNQSCKEILLERATEEGKTLRSLITSEFSHSLLKDWNKLSPLVSEIFENSQDSDVTEQNEGTGIKAGLEVLQVAFMEMGTTSTLLKILGMDLGSHILKVTSMIPEDESYVDCGRTRLHVGIIGVVTELLCLEENKWM